MQARILDLILFYPVFLFSLSVHETAHGWVSEKFGDPTARMLGRISLSPFPHMDIIGTVFLPIFGILTGAPVIGWGKPVPVDPRHYKDIRKHSLWVAASGPMSNIMLAIAFAGLARTLLWSLPNLPASYVIPGSFGATVIGALYAIFQMGVVLNLTLALFNMIPLAPLDGATVMRGVLPYNLLQKYDQISRYGMLILLALFVTGLLRYIFIPVFLLASILLPA
jgi:Zn-dependent protease